MRRNNILIIDDDNYTIELYNMIVDWSDYKANVSTELSVSKALDDLHNINENQSNHFPDFILLDLRMPEMHGFDFIRKFEESFPDKQNKTSFIITTSSVIKKEKEEAFKFDGVKDYLVKPIPADYLEKLVKEGLQTSKIEE